MGLKLFAACLLGVTLAGCASTGSRDAQGSTAPAAAPDWRDVATAHDRDRLRRWRDAWMTALPAARAADAAAIRAQGALFEPDRALPGALPPPGRYRCRVFKLGAQGPAGLDYIAYPYFDCRIDAEGELSSFYKDTGSQRPVGLLFEDGPTRAVFLGTLMLGDERAALDYGVDNDRDMAGFVERVGEQRWRMVLPWPRFESQLDVIELVPA